MAAERAWGWAYGHRLNQRRCVFNVASRGRRPWRGKHVTGRGRARGKQKGQLCSDQLCTIEVPVHALPWLQPHAYRCPNVPRDAVSLGLGRLVSSLCVSRPLPHNLSPKSIQRVLLTDLPAFRDRAPARHAGRIRRPATTTTSRPRGLKSHTKWKDGYGGPMHKHRRYAPTKC